MVDGKLRDSDIMKSLDPNQVEDISVIKGQAARFSNDIPDIPTSRIWIDNFSPLKNGFGKDELSGVDYK